jgi:hypothetical protein
MAEEVVGSNGEGRRYSLSDFYALENAKIGCFIYFYVDEPMKIAF